MCVWVIEVFLGLFKGFGGYLRGLEAVEWVWGGCLGGF